MVFCLNCGNQINENARYCASCGAALFMWSFGGSVNPNKKNYARAMLIVFVTGLILSIIFGAALTSIIGELPGGTGGYY